MGNTNSTDDTNGGTPDDIDPLDPFDGIETLGYRVLGVQPNSPASDAGLVSFLDFLVGCNGKMLLGSGEDLEPGMEYDDVDLPAFLEENKGNELEFLVYNFKSQETRLVNLTPNDAWGGAGLLGVTIRLDNYAGAEDRLVRILSVEPGSPAAIAGLVAETDFLLGTTHQTLDSVQHLAIGILRQNIDRVVELYVYNSDTDIVRVVALMPTYQWGEGDGLLGAEVGTGYLHRLPFKSRSTEGSCVERKVRYVKDSATKEFENEPQLEMELDDEVESVSLVTPEKPAGKKTSRPKAYETPLRASTTTTSEAAPQTEVSKPCEVGPAPPLPKQVEIPRSHSSSGVARSPSSYGLDPKEVKAIFEKPPPTPEETPANGGAVVHETPGQTVPSPQHEQASTPQSAIDQQYPSASTAQQQQPYPQPFYHAPMPATSLPSFSPPPINTTYQNQNGGAKVALSPLGPPPQLYYGANVASSYAPSHNVPVQFQHKAFTQPTQMSSALLPPPPVGYQSQQQPHFHAANPPRTYSNSS